ncbi:hypothetical protein SAMN04488103_105287 [Gemmobacter aquatilis]|uniref:Ribbon-helix-helix protein, copG family n=2 Tax=Gemmobacter aquatilis TaxID=933059 RepID=A0A1H8HA72_9RHOB|nr:hypothetical protein [Gemmobacter aquatilis]SEN52869.1 hypothetical protein SAMN04488103_105287 [Gemmobacter aquatilis]
MSYILKLPAERGEQLRQIAAAKNKTVPEIIGDYIRAEIDAQTIPADLPGVEVETTPSELKIIMPGFEGAVPLSQVRILTSALRRADDEAAPEGKEHIRNLRAGIAALSGVSVKRMGGGLKLVSPITGRKYPMAFGVAADLADQIDRATE